MNRFCAEIFKSRDERCVIENETAQRKNVEMVGCFGCPKPRIIVGDGVSRLKYD